MVFVDDHIGRTVVNTGLGFFWDTDDITKVFRNAATKIFMTWGTPAAQSLDDIFAEQTDGRCSTTGAMVAPRSVAKAAAKPAAKAAAKPAAKPSSKPAAKPSSKPAAKPSSKPAGKHSTAKPAGKLSIRPVAKPATKPITERQPGAECVEQSLFTPLSTFFSTTSVASNNPEEGDQAAVSTEDAVNSGLPAPDLAQATTPTTVALFGGSQSEAPGADSDVVDCQSADEPAANRQNPRKRRRLNLGSSTDDSESSSSSYVDE